MSVEKILSSRLSKIYYSRTDCDFMSSIFRFYQALYYSHAYLNRNNVEFYDLILRDFYSQLRKVRKDTLVFCIKRFFSRKLSSCFSIRSSYNELIDCLNPLACMYLTKIPEC